MLDASIWLAGAHTLVCAMPTDAVLRFYNYDTRSNYTLPLLADDGAVLAEVSVTALAYHETDGMLAVALSNGDVRSFRHLHEDRCAAI